MEAGEKVKGFIANILYVLTGAAGPCPDQAMPAVNRSQPDRTLPQLLAAQADKYKERVALRKKTLGIWQEISWREYKQQVRQVACGLLQYGIAPDECVSVISENRPRWLFVDIGIQSIQAVTAAIYVTSAAEQVAYILQHSKSRLIFAEDEEQLDKILKVRDQLPELEKIVVFDWKGLRGFEDAMVVSFDDFLAAGAQAADNYTAQLDRLIDEGRPEKTALLVYTSGTTGPPKGAMLSHHNLIWTSQALAAANPILESDEILSFLPLCHIAERLMTVVNQIVIGYTVNFAENLDTVPQNLREVSPTVFFAVPRIWEKFYSRILLTIEKAPWSKRATYKAAMRIGDKVARLRAEQKPINPGLRALYSLAHFAVFHPLKKRLGLERTRLAISGAAPISPQLLSYFHSLDLKLREVYGQTEGCGPTAIHQGEAIELGTVGPALPGVEVKIADDGEILVRGPNVFLGYFRDQTATDETLSDGYLHSGDVGEFDKNDFLKITDRKKDLIITAGGKNLAPQNIENQLKFSPYINDAVVIGDRRPFVSALILIDEENVSNFAQTERIPYTTYADLAGNEEILKLIDGESSIREWSVGYVRRQGGRWITNRSGQGCRGHGGLVRRMG